MSLRRKVAGGVILLVAAIATVSGASLWAINSLRQDLGFAVEQNERLRHLYEVATDLVTARHMLNLAQPQTGLAGGRVSNALSRLNILGDIPGQTKTEMRVAIEAALAAINSPAAANQEREQAVNDAIAHFRHFAAETRQMLADRQRLADERRRMALVLLAVLGATLTLASIAIGIMQYRSVAAPLRRMGAAARRIATGQFQQRLPEAGDEEIIQISRDFNRMAAELEELYRSLEQTVQARGRQLVQSERLAGVGYLAAGVAHEINNPLSIIAGHAELTLNRLKRDASADPRTLESLRLITEESFRCKGIIQKLLSLARGPSERTVIDLSALAGGMVNMLREVAPYRQRAIDFQADGDGPWLVRGSDGELRQVLLNLLINAAEATGEGGRIRVSLRRLGQTIELSIADNGRGMTAETAARIFEPFFSRRPPGRDGDNERGTGLGLSISHAIVENHGGRIWASSDGPDQGSRFVIELPSANS